MNVQECSVLDLKHRLVSGSMQGTVERKRENVQEGGSHKVVGNMIYCRCFNKNFIKDTKM